MSRDPYPYEVPFGGLEEWKNFGLFAARLGTLIIGVVLTIKCINLRLEVMQTFKEFSWSGGAVVLSKEYQSKLAWIDVYNLGMYTGVALMLIAVFGWKWKMRRTEAAVGEGDRRDSSFMSGE